MGVLGGKVLLDELHPIMPSTAPVRVELQLDRRNTDLESPPHESFEMRQRVGPTVDRVRFIKACLWI